MLIQTAPNKFCFVKLKLINTLVHDSKAVEKNQ